MTSEYLSRTLCQGRVFLLSIDTFGLPISNNSMAKKYDVIIWGATGFTGRLVAEYINHQYGVDQSLRWAMAGRNMDKMSTVAKEMGISGIDFIQADSHDRSSLDDMCAQGKVICTTVGPYAKYGTELVQSCIANGADYCDLTGEVQWMRKMIDEHQEEAEAKGVRIVHTCGFDSIPSDMGVHFLQREAMSKLGQYCDQIKLRVKAFKGGLSGGTYASLSYVMEQAQDDRNIYKVLTNPYSLNPDGHRTGPDREDLRSVVKDEDLNAYIGPFIMAGINTKVVRRSNALANFPYGKNFLYDEAIITGQGLGGKLKGYGMLAGLGVLMAGKPGSMFKKIVDKTQPKPGEGPNKQQRENGFFNIKLLGKVDDKVVLTAKVTGDRDPGYGSTSKMLAESAICLALDKDKTPKTAGMLTPAVAMGDILLDRLQAHAGLTFSIVS